MVQIDMPLPKCCGTCFALDDTGDYPFCLISGEQMGYTFNVNGCRMPHCPLKEEDVVRCKDCKHVCSRGSGLYCQFIECGKTGAFHKDDWFCADGERR